MDKSGNPTLRDRFPVACSPCGEVIKTARYTDGKLTQEPDDYKQEGIAHIDGAWVSLYRHRECQPKEA